LIYILLFLFHRRFKVILLVKAPFYGQKIQLTDKLIYEQNTVDYVNQSIDKLINDSNAAYGA